MDFLGSFMGGMITNVIILIAALAMTIFIACWTYRDAVSKGLNSVLWTLVVVLVPSYIGLIVYLCVRSDGKKVTCSNCLKQVSSRSKFCSNCGAELTPVEEVKDCDEDFVKSQKELLIGFFAGLGITIVASIVSIVFVVIGVVQATEKAIDVAKDVTSSISVDTLQSLDQLLGEQGIRVRVDGDEVFIKDAEGNNVIHVSGKQDGDVVEVNSDSVLKILDNLGVSVNGSLSEDEVEDLYEQLLNDMQELDGSEDLDQQLQNILEKYDGKSTTNNKSTTEAKE